jgi:hypothetical protein
MSHGNLQQMEKIKLTLVLPTLKLKLYLGGRQGETQKEIHFFGIVVDLDQSLYM